MNLRFPGQYYDQETGTHYNFHRDYKPNAGRYVQSDPIGLEAGVNLYAYSRNNSLYYFDSKGTFVDLREILTPWSFPIPTKMRPPPEEPIGNGCGDASTDKYIPDAYIGFDFSDACEAHDECYGTCGADKVTCDNDFLNDMLGECNRKNIIAVIVFGPRNITCVRTARAYYMALDLFGRPAYCAAQEEACPEAECGPIPGCS